MLIGVAAAAGLVLFFVAAIITHMRGHVYSFSSRGVSPAGRGLAGVATGLVLIGAFSRARPLEARSVGHPALISVSCQRSHLARAGRISASAIPDGVEYGGGGVVAGRHDDWRDGGDRS